MFSLIITIIAIALVAALALATIFYGDDIAGTAGAKSKITKALQEGNQIVGAIELYKADKGSLPSGSNEQIQQSLLSEGYLTAWPDTAWELRNDYAIISGMTESICLKLNQSKGVNEIPSCSAEGFESRSICCTTE